MGTNFNHCPNNSDHKPSGGIFGGAYIIIYECKKCGTCYCYKCGDRCPDCASKDKKEVGKVWAK